jgi:predicted DNA-binding transcriptional regulator AlpA
VTVRYPDRILFVGPEMEEQLIDINDLAGILKVPAKTIRNKLSNGTWPIEPLRIGKALRWRTSDVDAFLHPGPEPGLSDDPAAARMPKGRPAS